MHQAVRTTTIYVTHDQVEAMTLADRVVVMHDGRIEQVGPPQELYHRPATRFVAGFIGSPGMNFLPARVANGGDGLRLVVSDNITLPVPPSRVARYAPYKDREVLLGLRPEHLTEARAHGRPGTAPLAAVVDVTEPMGMETLVHFHVGKTKLCARCDPGITSGPGDLMEMSADLNHMHLIEPESGRVVGA